MWKLIFSLLITISAHALELQGHSRLVITNDQKEWSLEKGLFGIPFIYFSPQENDQRSNISFNDSEAEIPLNENDLKGSQDVYQLNKKSWAEQVHAKILSFLPYKYFKNKHGHSVHLIGLSYEHEGKTYLEKSYYINCSGKMIISKSLRLQPNVAHERNFIDLIENLNCRVVR